MSRLIHSTPRADGFRMPGEFEPQTQIWMLWPQRPDNWRLGAKPAQRSWVQVATAISRFEPVTVGVNHEQYENAVNQLPDTVRVVELSSNDAWVRDCGPTFVVNDQGAVRGVDWEFNAWGGLIDGLYFPWDQDDKVARKVCETEAVDTYRTDGFVLEGGSIHVDGAGTLITTEECLLNRNRNPHLSREEIEAYIASREWRGKAGGYAIQGLAGCFVQKLTGSYTSVVGLPLTEVVSMLVGEGFPIHFAWVRAAELDPT